MSALTVLLAATALSVSACGGDDNDSSGGGNGSSGATAVDKAYCAKIFSAGCDETAGMKTEQECVNNIGTMNQFMEKCVPEHEAQLECQTENMQPGCVENNGKTYFTDKNANGDACKTEAEAFDKCVKANYDDKNQ